MIEYTTGNILASEANFLVCPVNCVGTMGAGLAKQFRDYFPRLEERYREELKDGNITTAHPYILWTDDTGYDKNIVLFATKWDWKEPSELRWISWGLYSLREQLYNRIENGYMEEFGEPSIAFPKIGCGLGGLDWQDVKEELEYFNNRAPEAVRMIVYE